MYCESKGGGTRMRKYMGFYTMERDLDTSGSMKQRKD